MAEVASASSRWTRMPPIAFYAVSVILDKGFSLLTIPLVAAYLAPTEFGRLEVALSLIEFVGLIMALGLADTLVRFAGADATLEQRRQSAADLLGLSVIMVAAATVLLQLLLPTIAATLGVEIGMTALRIGVMGATITALIEMPLIWQRMTGRPGLYLVYVLMRSVAQVVAMFIVLRAGYGAEGMLVVNGAVMLAYGAVLVVWQFCQTGISVSRQRARDVGRYGVPLVGAALATFVLGNCNRWFLVGRVEMTEIAFLGLALKVALIVPLLLQPYYLWWSPQRLAVMQQPGGLERSAWAWGIGISILLMSATGLALGGPMLIHIALPASYAQAGTLVLFAICVCVLNELCTLCNAGAYARKTGLSVFAINVAGAVVAVVAYLVLIPTLGVRGALVSMMLGHGTRLVLFLAVSKPRIPFPATKALVVAVTGYVLVALAPAATQFGARFVWSTAAMILLAALVVALGLVQHPRLRLPVLTSMRRRLDAVER